MKRSRYFALELLVIAALSASVAADPPPFSGNPPWWASRGVLKPDTDANDSAALNQGQLKKMTAEAFAECSLKLSGFQKPGSDLDNLITSWATPGTVEYAAVTQGHVKAIASLFYDRFADMGLYPKTTPRTYPWSGSDLDYAMANAGQLKNLFRFFFPIDPTTQNLAIPIPDPDFVCEAGAFTINLPPLQGLDPGGEITWTQGRGPGSDLWEVDYLGGGSIAVIGRSPGYAIIDNGAPPTAGICVAGKYIFNSIVTYPGGDGKAYVTTNIDVSHSTTDPGINFAFGAAIISVGNGELPPENRTWKLKYDSCFIGVPASESGTCTQPPSAILDGRERTLNENIHLLQLMSTDLSNICSLFIRFTIPANVKLEIAGPGAGEPNYDIPALSTFVQAGATSSEDFTYVDIHAKHSPPGVILPPTTKYLFRLVRMP